LGLKKPFLSHHWYHAASTLGGEYFSGNSVRSGFPPGKVGLSYVSIAAVFVIEFATHQINEVKISSVIMKTKITKPLFKINF
jgi:hypothetical protein